MRDRRATKTVQPFLSPSSPLHDEAIATARRTVEREVDISESSLLTKSRINYGPLQPTQIHHIFPIPSDCSNHLAHLWHNWTSAPSHIMLLSLRGCNIRLCGVGHFDPSELIPLGD